MSANIYYRKLINTRKWQKLRRERLHIAKYLCENCSANDKTTAATEVHHIKPVESGATKVQMKALCYDPNNLVALCKACHIEAHKQLDSYSKKTVIERQKAVTDSFVDRFLTKQQL